MKKDTHVRYNEQVFKGIDNYCKDHNISVNAFQNLAATWFLTMKGYVKIHPNPVEITGTELKINAPPEEIKFYDGVL